MPLRQFDVVASVFGAMFAPRPERVAAELFRVTRLGGLVAMANYSSAGFLGRLATLVSRYGPAPAIPFASPFGWGDGVEVRRRFDGLASSIEVRQRTIAFEFDSVEEWLEFWERTNPPQIALRTVLSAEAYQGMLAEAKGLVPELNRPGSDRLILDSEYVQILALKADTPAA